MNKEKREEITAQILDKIGLKNNVWTSTPIKLALLDAYYDGVQEGIKTLSAKLQEKSDGVKS